LVTWAAIFPTPVMTSHIERDFTTDEIKYIRKLRATTNPNVGNVRSVATHVLDAPEMKAIRSIVAEHVNRYAWKIISADPRHTFFITQSWVNFTDHGQSHHRHIHTNSLISGVLYIEAKKEVDSICFYRSGIAAQILVSDVQTNEYNAPSWKFRVGVGDLILFPSELSHNVEQTTGEHTRISLAFNAFVRGDIGSAEQLNSLEI